MPFFLAPLRLGVRFSSISPRRMDFARDQKSHDPRRLDGNQGTQRQIRIILPRSKDIEPIDSPLPGP
jgi:hypothetical protein